MTQAGPIDTNGGVLPPEVATQYDADSGSAVPAGNVLEILGTTQAAGTTPVHTTGFGNTITTIVQLGQANIASSASRAGLVSFDSTSFGVDANGFVTFSGTMSGIDSINVDASSPPGTDPVLPDGSGLITMTGRQVPSLSVGANVIRSNSIAANSITYEIQQSGSNATESTNYNGVCHFDSSQFSVSNGFVSLIGGGLAIDSIDVQATSGGGTDPVVPTAAGLVTFQGALIAAGTNPIRAVSTAANTVQIQSQISVALAAQDSTKCGMCNFDSADFGVDANGFVTLASGGAGQTITGDTGGALSPTASNWNIVGAGSITTAGAVSTLTVQLTGLTNHAVLVGAGTTTITKVGPSATAGQVLQSAGAAADPAFSTATYPATATGTGTILRADGTNWVATTSTYPNTNAVSTLLYASSANVMAALATANNSILSTDGSGVPSLGTSLSNDYTFTKATSGATTTLTVSNSSNTASSAANIVASVAGGTAADPTHQSVISGVTTWTWGADNSNSDIFAIAASATLGTTDVMRITTTGQMTKPLQSSFLAYINTTITNITGDATTYTIIYDTEVYDRNNDFNLGTSTFTAPVTGLYDFDLEVLLGGGTSISLSFTQIVTTARTYQRGIGLSAGATTSAQGNNSTKANMTAGDTATFTITATDSGGKIDDLSGLSGAILRNWVSGELIA